mgnify:CR=1 FL=1
MAQALLGPIGLLGLFGLLGRLGPVVLTGGLLLPRFGDPEVCYFRKYNGPGTQKHVTVANSTVQDPDMCYCGEFNGSGVQKCVVVAN